MRKLLATSLLLAVLPLVANAATVNKSGAVHKKPVATAAKKKTSAKKSVASAAVPEPVAGPGQAARFSMTQNGKRMTADDFDKWYKEQQTAQAALPQAAPAAAN